MAIVNLYEPFEEDLQIPETVPIFPLPGTVLLPGEPLPLHIYEPRYKQMTEMALMSDRLIAMAHAKPGRELDGEENIYPIAGLGKIVLEERLPEGKFNLLLVGLRRVKIQKFVQATPYRKARVEMLNDHFSSTAATVLSSLESEILDLSKDFLESGTKEIELPWENPVAFTQEFQPNLPLGMLIDLAASVSPLSATEKQMILEQTDVVQRAEKFIFTLRFHQQSIHNGLSSNSSNLLH